MSGHSKWATTKHKKAAIDAKRGEHFARLLYKNVVGAPPAFFVSIFGYILATSGAF